MAQAVVLQMMRDGQELRRYHLDGSRKINRIGRGDAAHVHIDEPTASRVHAVVDFAPGGVMLTDMGAAGGTLLNGELIHRSTLSNGDRIVIGSTTLIATVGEARSVAAVAQDPNLDPSMVSTAAAAPVPSVPVAQPPAGQAAAHPSPAAHPAPTPAAPTPELRIPEAPSGPYSMPAELPQANPFAVSTAPRAAGWSPEEAAHDEALSDDDPIVLKMRREKHRNRIVILIATPAILGILIFFGWVALQQQVPDVEEPDYYSQQGAMSPEERARLAMFDTVAIRNADDFLYYRLTSAKSLDDIAREYYGRPSLVRYLVEANPKVQSPTEKLPVQTEVRIPRHVRYTLKKGDSPQKIAKKFLDDPSEATRLGDALGDPPNIWPGEEIKVPLLQKR